ncbi:DUF418 domain-containing protein [Oceanobacillus sp. CFH 90083]|uniref:DUF418 domain-containing protein n=1 Tax=Oceanobacillus sp. CFH 90083 TaxID=2592336 RepID=UPI00128DEB58|nr:DUF418 domain-containing protein [Oceanobacillus sp. CFH 90083]
MKAVNSLYSQVHTTPIKRKERMIEIDILRGFALFGIWLANITLFSSPSLYTGMLEGGGAEGGVNQVVQQLIYLLVDYKFISLFSFLFGVGFMIFLERVRQKGKNGVILYIRRLSVLLVIGLIHNYFIWFGDILFVYAILGFFLLLFRNSKPKTLLIWAVSLLVIPAVWIAMNTFAPQVVTFGPPLAPPAEEIHQLIDDSYRAYGTGGYLNMLQQRIVDMSMVQESSIALIPMTFAMFLLGAYVWRKNWFYRWKSDNRLLRRVWCYSGLIGSIFLIGQVILHTQVDAAESGYNYAHFAGALISGPAMSIFYITTLFLLLQKDVWRKRLAPLQDTGRMALTHYLLQSVVCTFLFYHYGLGLYGEVGAFAGFLLSCVIFAIQIIISKYWLRHFRFGPCEWLWRSLTYGKWQTNRLK